MDWQWAPQVFAAMHQGDLVILDARDNAYMVLAQAEGRIVLAEDRVRARLIDPALSDELAAAGLGVSVIAPTGERRAPPPARADLDAVEDREPVEAVALAGLAGAAVVLIWTFWLRSFPRLVRPVTAAAADDLNAEARIVRRALAFRRLLPWIPFQGLCLYRAALLRQYLGDDARRVTWVFGVSTWPFAAHCWLQCGELVLNDRLHRVSRYTPIMAV